MDDGTVSPGEDWRDPPEAPTGEADLTPVEGPELTTAIPDITLRRWPPRMDVALVIGGHLPLQLIGAGVGLSGFPMDSLRLSALYSAGLALDRSNSLLSHYAELVVSLELFGIDSGSVKDVYDKEPGYFDRPRPKPILRAVLPSHHGFLVEGGAFTATVALQSCVVNCELSVESQQHIERKRQLIYPFAGLRYLFYTEARSKKRPQVDRVAEVHAFAHLLLAPFNDWQPARYYQRLEPFERATFGFRAGFVIPGCRTPRCPSAGLTFGYLPSPGAALIEFSAGG